MEGDWNGRRLDPYVIDGRVGRDVNWKGWIRTLLMEGDWIRRRLEVLDPYVVDGRVGSVRRLEGLEGTLEATSIGRGLEGTLDSDVVDCSKRHARGCSYRTILLLLIVPTDVVVDCSD